MTETTKAASPIRLSVHDKDSRVLVHDGDKELLWTVGQVLRACQAYNSDVQLADVDEQVRSLWEVLTQWLYQHSDMVGDAYLQPGPRGRLLFLVVQKNVPFSRDLTDSLTDLDQDVAQDDRFELLQVTVRLVPPAPPEQIQALLLQA